MNAVLTVNNELLSASILSAVGILLVHIFIYSSGANTAEWTVKDAHITLDVSLVVTVLYDKVYRLILGVVRSGARNRRQDIKREFSVGLGYEMGWHWSFGFVY